jgi:hypothetical protein
MRRRHVHVLAFMQVLQISNYAVGSLSLNLPSVQVGCESGWWTTGFLVTAGSRRHQCRQGSQPRGVRAVCASWLAATPICVYMVQQHLHHKCACGGAGAQHPLRLMASAACRGNHSHQCGCRHLQYRSVAEHALRLQSCAAAQCCRVLTSTVGLLFPPQTLLRSPQIVGGLPDQHIVASQALTGSPAALQVATIRPRGPAQVASTGKLRLHAVVG